MNQETPEPDALEVRLGGYEGPLDLLLELARAQKVDLAAISILALVEQYLTFIAAARRLHLDLAADYLVMAAWLAYLKSRLLLPPEAKVGDEIPAEDLANRLQRRLVQLERMRTCGMALMERPHLGRDVFARGMPEALALIPHTRLECTLIALLRAYGALGRRRNPDAYAPALPPVYSLEAALERLRHLVGDTLDWAELSAFLPESDDPVFHRSALASTFVAALELARTGRADLDQQQAFGPIRLRRRHTGDDAGDVK